MLAPRDDDTTDINPYEDQHQYRGYLVDLLEALAKHASFTYSLYAVHDRQRGARQPDGTWNGLVGELITGVSIESVSNWQGCGLGLDVSISRRSREVPTSRLGLELLCLVAIPGNWTAVLAWNRACFALQHV